MENLTRLNTQVDALIAALHGVQDENKLLHMELDDVRVANGEKDASIRSLEAKREDQELRILTLEEAVAKKDAQIEELITRISQVLSALTQNDAPVTNSEHCEVNP